MWFGCDCGCDCVVVLFCWRRPCAEVVSVFCVLCLMVLAGCVLVC